MFGNVNCIKILITLLVVTGSAANRRKGRRPFWIIGHMVNSIHQLKQFLRLGANGIEADVKFIRSGTPWLTYHGFPCDCLRVCNAQETIENYLTYVKKLTTKLAYLDYQPRFSLLLLDLKTHQIDSSHLKIAGTKLAEVLYDNLFNLNGKQSSLKVLLGVEKTSHKEFIYGFLEKAKEENYNFDNRLGWQISENEDYASIYNMWNDIGNITNIWYSDGWTNCLILVRDKQRARNLLNKRTECNPTVDSFCPRKFYMWSVDDEIVIRQFWKLIDGVITNEPAYVKQLVYNDFKNHLRYANPYDDAWSKY